MTTPLTTAHRVKGVLVDVRVTADLDAVTRWCQTPEARARELADAARSFNEFIRDHRSQDFIRLHVEEVRQDQCSACHRELEVDRDGEPMCANCGAVLEGEV